MELREKKSQAGSVVSIRVLTQHAPGPEFHHRVRKERKKEKKSLKNKINQGGEKSVY